MLGPTDVQATPTLRLQQKLKLTDIDEPIKNVFGGDLANLGSPKDEGTSQKNG